MLRLAHVSHANLDARGPARLPNLRPNSRYAPVRRSQMEAQRNTWKQRLQGQSWRPDYLDSWHQKAPEIQLIVVPEQLKDIDKRLSVLDDGVDGMQCVLLLTGERIQVCDCLQCGVLIRNVHCVGFRRLLSHCCLACCVLDNKHLCSLLPMDRQPSACR